MSAEYTPTTEQVRAAFRKGSRLGWHSRRGRLFDRWLADTKAKQDKATTDRIIALLEAHDLDRTILTAIVGLIEG